MKIKTPMYFQLFFRTPSFKLVQLSCDTWQEVEEAITKRMPKFTHVEYHGSDGLIGIAYKVLDFKTGVYRTYKKFKGPGHPDNVQLQ